MLHGFMTAVREAGVAYEIPDELDLDSPADMIRDYVRRRSTEPDPPDGFACPGEVSALATITGMSDRGLSLGGVALPAALADLGLIDEYLFVVHPLVAGHGPRLLDGLHERLRLELVERRAFASGAVAQRYVPQR